MRSDKTVKAYFLAGIIISSFCFAYGKSYPKLTDVGQHATHESYDQLQRLSDEDTLITTVQNSPREHSHFTRANQGRITRITVANAYKTPSKWRKNKLHRFRKKKVRSTNKENQILQKIRHQDSSDNWLSRVVKKFNNSKEVIHRKSRDEETYENGDDDENIQSKDEDEDEDVQLIIIPRKPRKNLHPKVQVKDESDEDTINDPRNHEKISENSLDDSDNDHQNLRNFKDFNAKRKKLNKNRNDDATLTLERVVSDEDDEDNPKNNDHSGSNVGDYDLHLKVKDKSGTNVKLSGDLPGNIGNLMAVGEDGGTVQIKNANVKENVRAKGSEQLKTVDLQGAGSDATTDEMAQNLISIKSGKLKHFPYPSTVLLKPDAAVNEMNEAEVNEVKTNQARMPMESERDNKNIQTQALTPLTRDEANSKAEEPTNQQPSNSIFAPMEFENGDDELMATSRLLDIAQKADDVSSLKEVKEPSDVVKPESSKSLKDSANGAAKRQTSKAFLKSPPLSPEDYKKQTENIDKEANENWYKLQRLEDRVVNEGSSARTGKDVGSYNGQKVSVVTPSQLQLLQTEYPTYPAYLTPLLKSKVTGVGPPIVLPDGAIHGTQRNRFEIHDLTDISGGKWKAVHIPDENIASMLEITNQRKGGNLSMDIQHEERNKDVPLVEISGVKLPVEVHGRVHAFEQNLVNNKSRNGSATVGKLIVATENEHQGKEMGPLKEAHPSVLKLRGYMKEEGPKNREEIHRKTSVKPSLVVAKVSEDDDSDVEDDLPLRKLPKPIVAPLRKTRPVIRLGSMRSNILAGVIHPSDKSQALSPLQNSSNNSQQNSGSRNEVTDNHPTNTDPEVLEKIKSLLLKSHSNPTPTPVSSPKPRSKTQNIVPASTPNRISPTPQVPRKLSPARPNNDGLFLPKFSSQTDAFSNHASVLDRISSPKKEALLIGIIKALLDRDRFRTSSARANALNGATAGLPHYNRQAVLQGLENLQMRKTVANSENDATTPELDPENTPTPGKSMDEIYQKEREEEVKKELGRANEEALEANKMRQEESVMLANYDRFSNPESRGSWANIGGTQQSETPDGQLLSMLGPQQLNMVEDNPSAT